MLSTQDLQEHRWRRKIWERGFGTLQLKTYESRVNQHLDVLIHQLKERAGGRHSTSLRYNEVEHLLTWPGTVDFTSWCEFFAYDVMSDLGFSEDFGMLREGKPHRYISALHGNARIIFTVAQTPWMRPLLWLFPVDAQSKKDSRDFRKISTATYERRKAKLDVKQQDMFETIANNPEGVGPRPLTEAEIMADAARKLPVQYSENPIDISSNYHGRINFYSSLHHFHLLVSWPASKDTSKATGGDRSMLDRAISPRSIPDWYAVPND